MCSHSHDVIGLGIYHETVKNKKLGLDKNLLGTKIVPFLIPLAMEPVLKLSQVWSGHKATKAVMSVSIFSSISS